MHHFGRRRWTIAALAAVVMATTLVTPTEATVCDPVFCDPFRCSVVECSGRTILDRCGCCLECARVVNETCGGPFLTEGPCDVGLVCEITVSVGSEISGNEVGVCKEPPRRPEVSSCENVTCGNPPTPDCPADSALITEALQSDKCCPQPPSCSCKPCLPSDHSLCPSGYVRVLKTEGSHQPGNCCDIHECIEHAQFCDHVLCDSNLFSSTCPEDSVALPASPVVLEDNCCPTVKHECTCKPKSRCPVHNCPVGMQRRVRKYATGFPGNCCDHFDCINGSNPVCLHNGVIRADGDIWKLDECITCNCKKGLTFCEPAQCPELGRCSWFGRPEGQCCDVCKGCVSQTGELYPSNATWQQDSCVMCHCDEGQVYCQAQLCAITCSNPRTVPGQCCPECERDEGSITLAPRCPTLSYCKLKCPHGYKKGLDGCYMCQCKDSPDDGCDLNCPNGFNVDTNGIEICDCAHASASVELSTPSAVPSVPSTLSATSACLPMVDCTRQCSYGYRRDKSGCLRCRCNKCPLVADCTKKCASGFVYNLDGCRLCKCLDSDSSETVAPLAPVGTRRCVSFAGERLEEGQLWWDGCRKCFCHQGQEMCALIVCPAIRCANPVMRPGNCCPSCGGEKVPPLTTGVSVCHSSDGRYFVEGEMWQLDECTQCICHQGSALCTIDNCPPTLCHQPIVMPHSCCPVCPDKNGFLPSQIPWKKKPLRSCRSNGGNHYSNGDTWQINACQSCTCRDGQVHCFSQTCPILRCNKTFLKKDQCCPMCLDNSAKHCSYDENIYSLGETWLVDDCTKCICSAEGRVLCLVTVCDVPKCKAPVSNAGSCCPFCPNITENLAGDNLLSRTYVTAPPDDNSEKNHFNQTLVILLTAVAILISIVILLLVLLLRKRKRREYGIYNSGSRPAPVSLFSYIAGSNCCPKPTNLDYKIQNRSSASSGTASSKLSSSDHSAKPSVLSCTEAKPSDSDESLLNNSFPMGCITSSDDSIKLTEPRSSPTPLDFEIRAHFNPMDRIRMKHANRRSTGDELEQTRHLLTATPSLGVTNNNRKSW